MKILSVLINKCSKLQVQQLINMFEKVDNYGEKFINLDMDSTTNEKDSAARYYDNNHHSEMFNGLSSAYCYPWKTINPYKFWLKLKDFLESKHQVKFIHGNITNLKQDGNIITSIEYVQKDSQLINASDFDYFVISCGIGSLSIGQFLGIRVPIFGFKGHSLNLYIKPKQKIVPNEIMEERELTRLNDEKDYDTEIPAMPAASYAFNPENVCIVRLGRHSSGLIRVTGYWDLVGNNTDTIESRKDALIDIAKDYFGKDLYDEEQADHWVGVRPISADDVPIIGKSTKLKNVFWNTGHGGRGITFSLGSGKILSRVLENHDEQSQNAAMKNLVQKINLENYSPSRFQM